MKSIVLSVAVLVFSSFASAQTILRDDGGVEQTPAASTIPFLEGTDVFWTVYGESALEDRFWPYRLEADLFPHLVVQQDYTKLLDVDRQETAVASGRGLKRFAYAISGTPAVRLRMLRSASAPVRTPSYMPRGNFQVFWLDLPEGDRRALESRPSARAQPQSPQEMQTMRAAARAAIAEISTIRFWEGHVIVGHHSNGQEGCITREQERDPDSTECVPAGIPVTLDTINEYDGSFSTNYVRIGVNHVRYRLGGTTDPDTGLKPATREARIGAEFEYHPRSWVDEDIVELMGRARVRGRAAYAWRGIGFCGKRLEAEAGLTWNPGVTDGLDELSAFGQLSCFPAISGGWGFFVRVYDGQDYYNIGFLRSITRLHVGLTFNQTDWFRFRRRSPDDAASR